MDNAVRVVVFIGTGRGFCAGDNLKGYAGENYEPGTLVPPISHGHDSGIGTYNGLRQISQAVNLAIRRLDKTEYSGHQRGSHPDRTVTCAVL